MEKIIYDGLTLFFGIVIEAFPFLLLGSIVSTIIHVFVKTETFVRYVPQNKLGACVTMSLIGMVFPVCECGNIPVARKLLQKKVTGGASLSFLLGAPILNPIVIATTVVAFPSDPQIWWGRIILAFFISVLVGFLFSFEKTEKLITNNFSQKSCSAGCSCDCDHTHKPKLAVAAEHTMDEFLSMASIMIIGAMIAASMQTFFPREIIIAIGETPLLSIIAMMGLGFVISICSTTDAFFALAYAHQFSAASLIAFLVFGPMIDIKALLLMRTTYTTKTLVLLVLLVGLLVLTSTYAFDLFF